MIPYFQLMEQAAKYCEVAKPRIKEPGEAVTLCRPMFLQLEAEQLLMLVLNAKYDMIEIAFGPIGLVDRTQSHAREIFRRAIILNASGIILLHNHPSGDPNPSTDDISMTRGLLEAGKIIGIKLLDHIVVGKCTTERSKDWISMRESNLM